MSSQWQTKTDSHGNTHILDESGFVVTVADAAKARLIVQAVNAHDQLVTACRDALNWIEPSDYDPTEPCISIKAQTVIDALRQALPAAGQEVTT